MPPSKIEVKEIDPNEPKQTWRKYFYKAAKNEYLQRFIIFLIIVNSVFMGIGTFSFVRSHKKVQFAFDVLDQVLLAIFTVELGINLFAYDLKFFKDPWFIFDLMTVIPSYIFPNVKIIRAFRIFRAFRLFGRVEALKKILIAIFSTGPQMMSIAVVLLLLFYIFAVMFTQLYGDCYNQGCYCEDAKLWRNCPNILKGVNYFGRLDFTLFTLFVLMTMDDWSDIVRQTQRYYPWAWGPLVFFIVLSSFVMLNLVVAVLCDALQALEGAKANVDKEEEKNAETVESVEEAEFGSVHLTSSPLNHRLRRLSNQDASNNSNKFNAEKLYLLREIKHADDEMQMELTKLTRKITGLHSSLSTIEHAIDHVNEQIDAEIMERRKEKEKLKRKKASSSDEEPKYDDDDSDD